jgi:thiol:disulfide interchange protein DsbD
MKKHTGLFSILILCCIVTHAQTANPVKWAFDATKLGDKSYELHIKASIDQNWHLYSQNAGDNLMATVFTFTPNPLIKPDGKLKESGDLKTLNDPKLRLHLNYYYDQVDFIQKIRMKANSNTIIKGIVSYVVCNDLDGKCLPTKKVPFSIAIAAK